MNPRSCRRFLAVSLLLSSTSLAACAVDTTADGDAAESTASDLSAAGKALIGSYEGGATLLRLDLTSTRVGTANAFTADVDAEGGPQHLEGTFTAGAKTITFRATNPGATAARFFGRYTYVASGGALALSRAGVTEMLEKAQPPAPGPLGTCGAGTFTQAFADQIAETVAPVPGNTDHYQAPPFKRQVARFQGRKWTRGADGQWSSAPTPLDGFHGDLYLGSQRANGAFEVVAHAKTTRYVSRDSSMGELRRYVYFEGSFDARPASADVAAPVTLAGQLSESPWGSFGTPPAPLVFRGQVRFTDHCFSMLDAPVTAATTEVNEAFATY
jgi:hypothetical protein